MISLSDCDECTCGFSSFKRHLEGWNLKPLVHRDLTILLPCAFQSLCVVRLKPLQGAYWALFVPLGYRHHTCYLYRLAVEPFQVNRRFSPCRELHQDEVLGELGLNFWANKDIKIGKGVLCLLPWQQKYSNREAKDPDYKSTDFLMIYSMQSRRGFCGLGGLLIGRVESRRFRRGLTPLLINED